MTQPFDLVIMGHVALDTVIHVDRGIRSVHKVSLGGAVTFSSLATKTSNPALNVGIATKTGNDFPDDLLASFTTLGVDTSAILRDDGAGTTRFELVYEGASRALSCTVQCSPLRVDELPDNVLSTKSVHLGPLCREIDASFIERLGELLPRETIVGVDLQGFLRNVHEDGTISFISPAEGERMVSLLHETFGPRLVIKGDDAECRAIMPGGEASNSAPKTMSFFLEAYPGATILITSGRYGSIVGRNDGTVPRARRIPAFRPRAIVDETGAGDTFLGSFLSRLNGPPRDIVSCEAAAFFASAASSFLVEGAGFDGLRTVPEIEARVTSRRYFTE